MKPIRRCIALVPARGGSKGIPRKNLKPFCGRPLIEWTLRQALAAESVHAVYVTSDDDEILDIARRAGAQAIRRPESLATDTATTEAALRHALEHPDLAAAGPVDAVVLLQVTSPLRRSRDIDGAVARWREDGVDAVFSACEMADACLWRQRAAGVEPFNYDPDNRGRRQDRDPLILENGSIYVFSPEAILVHGNRLFGRRVPYLMPAWTAAEIDTVEEMDLCEVLFDHYLGMSRRQEDV